MVYNEIVQTGLSKDQKVLVEAFYKVKTKKDITRLISDLFTDEEILDLSQRLKTAQSISQGKTYEDIAKQVKVSTSTISKIGQILKFGKGGFKLIQPKAKAKKSR